MHATRSTSAAASSAMHGTTARGEQQGQAWKQSGRDDRARRGTKAAGRVTSRARRGSRAPAMIRPGVEAGRAAATSRPGVRQDGLRRSCGQAWNQGGGGGDEQARAWRQDGREDPARRGGRGDRDEQGQTRK